MYIILADNWISASHLTAARNGCLSEQISFMPITGYPIRIAAKRSGLTPHVIRAWEKRHQATEPKRTGTNRRLYSEEDVERLSLLRAAIGEGHRIGNIATLPSGELRRLLATGLAPATQGSRGLNHDNDVGCLEAGCLEAMRRGTICPAPTPAH